MRRFNITGICYPDEHYMVDISDRFDYYRINKGYMLSFCFNKNSKPEAKTINLDGREIVEVVV